MLGIDGERNVVWNYSAATAGAHDGDEHIAGPDRVPLEFFVLRVRDVTTFSPPKLVIDGVIDAKNCYSLIHKLAVQKLAAERARTNAPVFLINNFSNAGNGPAMGIALPKHIEKEGLGEAVEQGQGGAALGSEGFGLVEEGGDAALFFQRGKCDLYLRQIASRNPLPRSASRVLVNLIPTLG